jgi:RHS repeat-associated protein
MPRLSICTIYIGGLYEEDITPGGTVAQYTSYYNFAGKLVGMCRVVGTTSTQYRMVGDHLGSTSLIVDAQNTPQVVQRTYNKPYGEVAYSWSSSGGGPTSLTSIGYTGQRLEGGAGESGLMYYGARFYDPVLSYFVSADTIAPGQGAPQTRNRYSYVLNNPLGLTDPSGHQARRADDPADYSDGSDDPIADDDERADFKRCTSGRAGAEAYCYAAFHRLGISLQGLWKLPELIGVLMGLHDLLDKARWSYGDFQHAMGMDDFIGRDSLIFDNRRREGASFAGSLAGADATKHSAYEYSIGAAHVVEFYEGAFTGDALWLQVVTVHEVAHALDDASSGALSRGMMAVTGGRDEVTGVSCGPGGVCGARTKYTTDPARGRPLSGHGGDSSYEDFAEAVAAWVYPTYGEFRDNYSKSGDRIPYVERRLRKP